MPPRSIPAAKPKRPETIKPAQRDPVSTLSTVVDEQMNLLTAQRDILTRVELLLIELVQAQLGSGGGARTPGSTIVTFAQDQGRASLHAG